MKIRPLGFGMISLGIMLAVNPPIAAHATDAREAIRLCDKNPKCDYKVNKNGSVNITVGDNIIYCPQEGNCHCDICSPPGRVAPGIGKVAPAARVGNALKM